MTPECMDIPLILSEKIEIIGDYILPLLSIQLLFILIDHNILKPRVIKYLFFGFIICAPFEYIQPKLGWVSYLKCETYYWEPIQYMWFIQSLWDTLILLFLYSISKFIWSYTTVDHIPIPITMSIIGMILEIYIESHQTLWYYTPTKWNRQWAVINGRPMTLQQWHWSILPAIYYNFISDKNM